MKFTSYKKSIFLSLQKVLIPLNKFCLSGRWNDQPQDVDFRFRLLINKVKTKIFLKNKLLISNNYAYES